MKIETSNIKENFKKELQNYYKQNINYVLGCVEPPEDGRDEYMLDDDEYDFAEKGFEKIKKEKYAEALNEINELSEETLKMWDEEDEKIHFVLFFQSVVNAFEEYLKSKGLTINYNSEVFE
jgi:HD-GYP domain-containing protein (c-di-GMP phosphodiesterase class II)